MSTTATEKQILNFGTRFYLWGVEREQVRRIAAGKRLRHARPFEVALSDYGYASVKARALYVFGYKLALQRLETKCRGESQKLSSADLAAPALTVA